MEIASGLALSGIAVTFFWLSNRYKNDKVGMFEVLFNLGHIFAIAALVVLSNTVGSAQYSAVISAVFQVLIWVYFFVFLFMFIKMWRNLITFMWKTHTLKGYLY